MAIRAPFFFALLAAGMASAVACSSKNNNGTTSSTAATTSSKAATSGSASGAGGACMSDAMGNCQLACTELYNCGLAMDAMTMKQNCPGFKGGDAEKNTWLNGTGNNGCIQSCMGQMALTSVVDKCDCTNTVKTIEGLNMTFKSVCEMGFQGGAGGATAGAGGSGGAK